MEKLYTGKTKDVYKMQDGNFRLQFKDDVTGENGVFDPGANTVGLSIDGMGKANLAMSSMFFKLIEEKGYPTHFLGSDIEGGTMDVKPAETFGKGLEVICRFKAVGSFMRRFSDYAKEGEALDAYVEMTIKNDDACDPVIDQTLLELFGILKVGEYAKVYALTQNIAKTIAAKLAECGLQMYDTKLEFGRDINGNIMLIDEISSGNMRVYRDGEILKPLELTALLAK